MIPDPASPALGMPPGPVRWRTGVIERAVLLTPRVRSLMLRVADWPGHVPGQHVDIRLTAEDGYRARRGYSIASVPGGPLVELAVERLEDGEVSPFLHDVAAPGDSIDLRGPLGGYFNWQARDGGPLLLVGGGSGVVPLVSMLRHRAAAAPGLPALLLCSARQWDEVVFRDELLAREADEPGLTLVVALTREKARRPGDLDGRIDRGALDGVLSRLGGGMPLVYVCGSSGFVAAIAAGLVAWGIPAPRIRTERYGGT